MSNGFFQARPTENSGAGAGQQPGSTVGAAPASQQPSAMAGAAPANQQPNTAAGTPPPGYSSPAPVGAPWAAGPAAYPPPPGTPRGVGPALPPPPAPQGQAPAAPARRRRRRPVEIAFLAIALAILLVACMVFYQMASFSGAVGSLLQPVAWQADPPDGTFSVVQVVGTIQNVAGDALGIYEPSYHHYYTVEYIKQLAQDPGNTGILLYMDTPGGTVMECDEVYLALMDYKARTGRPVWAYMAGQCASAGYYITSAADHIVANRQTLTGSIGVYITLSDTSGLYEKLGIETVLIRSGDNKGVGTEGVEVTPAQREVYQGIVDEFYETFVGVVAQGRGMALDTVRQLADGRPYTGTQALNLGLVDDVGDWDTILADFEVETASTAYWPNFSQQTALGRLLAGMASIVPKGEADTLISFAESLPSGVPYSYYPAQ